MTTRTEQFYGRSIDIFDVASPVRNELGEITHLQLKIGSRIFRGHYQGPYEGNFQRPGVRRSGPHVWVVRGRSAMFWGVVSALMTLGGGIPGLVLRHMGLGALGMVGIGLGGLVWGFGKKLIIVRDVQEVKPA